MDRELNPRLCRRCGATKQPGFDCDRCQLEERRYKALGVAQVKYLQDLIAGMALEDVHGMMAWLAAENVVRTDRPFTAFLHGPVYLVMAMGPAVPQLQAAVAWANEQAAAAAPDPVPAGGTMTTPSTGAIDGDSDHDAVTGAASPAENWQIRKSGFLSYLVNIKAVSCGRMYLTKDLEPTADTALSHDYESYAEAEAALQAWRDKQGVTA
jgi:ribosomal protein L40E